MGGGTLGDTDAQDFASSDWPANYDGRQRATRLTPGPVPGRAGRLRQAVWLLGDESRASARPRAIGGDSAGHQAAETLLPLRDRHGITDGFDVRYGGFELKMTPSQRLWGERGAVDADHHLSPISYCPAAIPSSDATLTSRRYSRSCRRYPPAIFTVGTADPLLERHAVHGGAVARGR